MSFIRGVFLAIFSSILYYFCAHRFLFISFLSIDSHSFFFALFLCLTLCNTHLFFLSSCFLFWVIRHRGKMAILCSLAYHNQHNTFYFSFIFLFIVYGWIEYSIKCLIKILREFVPLFLKILIRWISLLMVVFTQIWHWLVQETFKWI